MALGRENVNIGGEMISEILNSIILLWWSRDKDIF
jgi:hypothetical protein